jgi:hypothetical protein
VSIPSSSNTLTSSFTIHFNTLSCLLLDVLCP